MELAPPENQERLYLGGPEAEFDPEKKVYLPVKEVDENEIED